MLILFFFKNDLIFWKTLVYKTIRNHSTYKYGAWETLRQSMSSGNVSNNFRTVLVYNTTWNNMNRIELINMETFYFFPFILYLNYHGIKWFITLIQSRILIYDTLDHYFNVFRIFNMKKDTINKDVYIWGKQWWWVYV